MKPIRLSWSNIHSYHGEHSIEFDGLRVVGVSGSNGSGKSTALVDIPTWICWGKTRAGADSIIAPGENHAWSEFIFELAGVRYRVKRQKDAKRSTLSFCSFDGGAWVPLDGPNMAETQQRIEKWTGLNYDLATRTVWSVQGEADKFSGDAPADRKGTLLHLLDADYWEEQAVKLRKQLQALTAEQTALVSRYELARLNADEAEGLRAKIIEIAAKVESAEAGLYSAQESLQAAQEARSALQAEHVGVEARRRELARLEAAVDDKRADESRLRLELITIGKQIAGAEGLTTSIAAAEIAETNAAAYEALRQQDDALLREAETLKTAAATAHREHKSACQALFDKIAAARREHNAAIARTEDKLDLLSEQAQVIEQVPCTEQRFWLLTTSEPPKGVDLAGACPLLAIAREARDLLPETEKLLATVKQHDPATEDEKKLATLEEEKPWGEAETRLANIPEDRLAVGYLPGDHEKARKLASTLPDLRKQQADLAGHVARKEETQKQLDALAKDLAKATTERDEAAEHPDLKRDWRRELSDAGDDVLVRETLVEVTRKEIAEAEKQRAVMQERLERAESAGKEAEALAGEIAEAKARAHRLTLLEESCGKKGLPQWIIEGALPQLQDAANDFLRELSDGRFAVSLVTQAPTKRGTTVETLDIVVSDADGPRPLETFSGGEKVRINLALRMGLTGLLSHRAGVRLQMAVWDEPSLGLDNEGVDALVQCVPVVAKRLDFLGIVFHDQRLKGRFEQEAKVWKDSIGSHLEVQA